MRLLPADWRVRALVLAVVSLLVCWYLARQIDIRASLALLRGLQWQWLVLALVSFLSGHLFRYARYLMVWGWQPGLPSLGITALHGFASYFLPLRLGELVLPVLARRLSEQSFLSALGGLIWIRLFDVVMVLSLAAVAVMTLGPDSVLVGQLATTLSVAPAALTGTTIDLLMVLLVLLLALAGWWMLGRFERLAEASKRMRFVLLSVLVWVAVLVMNEGIASALSVTLGFPELVWLVVGTTFAYALPVQGLAGLGVHQLVWFLALVGTGMARQPALELTVATHVLVVACVMVLGVLGLLVGLAGRQGSAENR